MKDDASNDNAAKDDGPQANDRPLEGGFTPMQRKLHEIIFEADTFGGKAFDVGLFIAIGLSIGVVMLDSVEDIRAKWRVPLVAVEWALTILFTIEYVLRLYCVRKPWRYATSFFGVVDLLAILPTYLSLFIWRSKFLAVVRVLRLLRVFRVLKLASYLTEAQSLLTLLRKFHAKITVFVFAVMTIVLIMGATMYVIEGKAGGFDSIPRGVYWAIVTITTVGYGDISPKTLPGQAVAALAMLIGYAIIVVPASIFSAEVGCIEARGYFNTSLLELHGRRARRHRPVLQVLRNTAVVARFSLRCVSLCHLLTGDAFAKLQ